MNPYRVLGVKKKATQEEIKNAYKEKAKQFHPDKEGGDEEKFKKINEAYNMLKDEELRSYFDKTGTTPNSKEAQTITEVINLFKNFIIEKTSNDQPIQIETVSARIKNDISNISKSLLNLKRVKDNVEEQIDKVKMKIKLKPNVYQIAINNVISELSDQIKQQESVLKRLNEILKVSSNYETIYKQSMKRLPLEYMGNKRETYTIAMRTR